MATMDSAIWLAIITGVIGLVSPVIVAVAAAWQHSRDKREDWARQDLVASRLMHNNTLANAKLDNLEAQGAATHALVNSNYTEIMQALLDSLVAQLAMMRKISNPSQSALDDIRAIEEKIAELRKALSDRGRIPT